MSDLIRREDAIKAYNEAMDELVKWQMEEWQLGDFSECEFNTTDCKHIVRKLEAIPTIDAVSVVHGEWKPFDLKWGRSIWYCTACEEGVEVPCDIWTHKPIYNYCPNCGARMKTDGEAKESE